MKKLIPLVIATMIVLIAGWISYLSIARADQKAQTQIDTSVSNNPVPPSIKYNLSVQNVTKGDTTVYRTTTGQTGDALKHFIEIENISGKVLDNVTVKYTFNPFSDLPETYVRGSTIIFTNGQATAIDNNSIVEGGLNLGTMEVNATRKIGVDLVIKGAQHDIALNELLISSGAIPLCRLDSLAVDLITYDVETPKVPYQNSSTCDDPGAMDHFNKLTQKRDQLINVNSVVTLGLALITFVAGLVYLYKLYNFAKFAIAAQIWGAIYLIVLLTLSELPASTQGGMGILFLIAIPIYAIILWIIVSIFTAVKAAKSK